MIFLMYVTRSLAQRGEWRLVVSEERPCSKKDRKLVVDIYYVIEYLSRYLI